MLQSMGSQRARHNLLTEHQLHGSHKGYLCLLASSCVCSVWSPSRSEEGMNENQHLFPGSLLLGCLDCCIHPPMSHSSSQDMACIHSLLLGSINLFFSSLGLTPWLLISLMLLYCPCGSSYTCSFVSKCSLQYLILSVPSTCPQNPDGSSLDTSCNLHGR